MSKVIHIAAALLHDGQGKLLLVRKRGTQAFMQPGGKLEPGEPALAALVRELEEELGLQLGPGHARFMAQLQAPAANEPGHSVRCELFEVCHAGPVAAAAELAEAHWASPAEARRLVLAPLTGEQILPLFEQLLSSAV